MDPTTDMDLEEIDTRTAEEIAEDEARERDELLESLEYDRQEERGLDAWRGLDG